MRTSLLGALVLVLAALCLVTCSGADKKKDGKAVKYDDEKTGYGWRSESVQPAYVGVQPSSCQMKRPPAK